MKRMLILFCGIAAFACACASRAPIDVTPPEHNLDGVMHLVGRFGFGHACPCDGLILTAAHVAHPLYLRPGLQNAAIEYAWSDERGGEGFLISEYLQLGRDLGFMRSRRGEPAYYKHAIQEPQIGDELYWSEYDYSSLKKAFAPIEKRGCVIRRFAGHLVLDHKPVAGASGTCVFNEGGEVVAIVAWGHRIGAAIVVSVYGQWWPGDLER